MHRAMIVVAVFALEARASPLFQEDFELNGGLRVDAGGVWTEIYPGSASMLVEPAAAHRGARGLRINRSLPIPTDGNDSQLEVLLGSTFAGETWVRWWMRVAPTALAPQMLMNFGDTTVPNHLGLSHDPSGFWFLTGFQSDGGFFLNRMSAVPDTAWHLYELGILGMGQADGGYLLVIDGQDGGIGRAGFDFSDAGQRQLNLGLTYGAPRAFLGAVDYDDVRVTTFRPTGLVRIGGVSGPWFVGQCIRLRIDFATSDSSVARIAEIRRSITVTTSPSYQLFDDTQCTVPTTAITAVPGDTSSYVFIRPSMSGPISLGVSEPDLLPSISVLTVAPALDAGQPDAGRDAGPTDAGVVMPDGGEPDGGALDAGLLPDAGAGDAGPEDAGTSGDAGTLADAGAVADAGTPDAGVNNVLPDAGVAPHELDLRVGCGCDATSLSSVVLSLLASLALRRRR